MESKISRGNGNEIKKQKQKTFKKNISLYGVVFLEVRPAKTRYN